MIKKELKIIGIDCPNCAKGLETDFNKIVEINNFKYSFFNQKCTFEIEEDNLKDVMKKIDKIIKELDLEYEVIK